ncbi:putative flavohemoprotein [Halobacteriovorax sp. BALOs_7]|uniref:NO-inducible flavohemoprotein n=1 Tax=Halobacteriovorax sp. BALOs_7 TaxID=2109558 RepID=UPI000EA13E55|nr:NO-inducible flavohemoprotein [Halobacteriovorax sp. BALOs_7]AYF44985.1 putative flavohemoprotein [Halobacteriovorax sp. BALOs_7]
MLSTQTIEIVKSTAPVLEENGVLLTKHFYQKMFENNPEVLPYFNRAHQNRGSQQEALAGAICAYAKNIDNLDALGGAVSLITNKHAALKVEPEHYPIVGVNLLASIKDVLGDAATDEIINAWKEAYFFLADILIDVEKGIYNEQAYESFKEFKVEKKVDESEIITSFYLRPSDNSKLPSFTAGQYITVRVPYDGITTMRNYSLSDYPVKDLLRISVKREEGSPDGYVSNYLHSKLSVGDTLEVAAPVGDFTYKKSENGSVFLAGGIGITPLLSMVKAALIEGEPRVEFIHANKSRSVQAFKNELSDLSEKYKCFAPLYFYENSSEELADNEYEGFITKDFLEKRNFDLNSNFYICGPSAFMAMMKKHLLELGVDPSKIFIEFFGPLETL